ncbi:DUF413 domain-containing protein [Pseudomaricurvus sp.]|uniref:DUF413 domain-containing protein n=1 Tax=Pseudomaricurvus sp. TaxID=2004510 RepID=UPI003F6B67FD
MTTQSQDFDQKGRKFWGTDHFPYGFSRSGEFTREQVQFLEDHGYAYQALALGEREPQTSVEKDFVEFCRGERDPQNKHEKVWDRFMKKSTQREMFVTLGASSNDDDGASMATYDDVEDF